MRGRGEMERKNSQLRLSTKKTRLKSKYFKLAWSLIIIIILIHKKNSEIGFSQKSVIINLIKN